MSSIWKFKDREFDTKRDRDFFVAGWNMCMKECEKSRLEKYTEMFLDRMGLVDWYKKTRDRKL